MSARRLHPPSTTVLAAILLFAFARLAAAAIIPFTLHAFDNLLNYRRSEDEVNAWNHTFTDSTFNPNRPFIGSGRPYVVTDYQPNFATYMTTAFYGTGVEVFGFWGDVGDGDSPVHIGGSGSVALSLTGTKGSQAAAVNGSGSIPQSPKNSVAPVSLAAVKGLEVDWYTMTLEVTSGEIAVTSAVVDMSVGAE